MYNDTMIIGDGDKKFRIDGELARAVSRTIQEHGVHCVKISSDNAQREALDRAISAVRNMPFVGDHIKELVIDELKRLRSEVYIAGENDEAVCRPLGETSTPLTSIDDVVKTLSGQKPTTLP